ncbi:hypothetical protein SAMN05216601_11169 [Ectopseudomonas composti]|uniref:Uncharacterized protein n=1 Tax=Ectopseudomonas composti TaxID=658457 RepID=A0A1I5Q8Q8_9GAMM|nr:hypothetical protein [Pseudomonas composti]SFP42663.1 hypothetical protein SAMN05216601_11169 [Pseudomonas composti]
MKADMDDMPEYLKTRKQEGPWRMVAIMAIGTGVVVGGLSLFGGGFIDRAKTIASGDGLRDDIGLLQPQPKQQESARPQGAVARRETYTPPQTFRTEEPLVIERGGAYDPEPTQPERQTVFNDQNYRPQGAANVVSFNAPVIASEKQQATAQTRQEIVIVGQEQKPGDWVCTFIGGEGSLERRNCKSSMQLHNRNQSYSGNRSP